MKVYLGVNRQLLAVVTGATTRDAKAPYRFKLAKLELAPLYDEFSKDKHKIDLIFVDKEAGERKTYPQCQLLTSIRPVTMGEKSSSPRFAADVEILCSSEPKVEKIATNPQ